MSESGPAESEEEEELDDQSLGIKSNSRAILRLSPRRKSAAQQKQQQHKSKGTGRGGGVGEGNARRGGLAVARRQARSPAGSSAQGGSSSESSSSDSSDASSSSSESGSDTGARVAGSGRPGRGGKPAPSGSGRMGSKPSPKKDATARDEEKERQREERSEEPTKGKGQGHSQGRGGAHTQLGEARYDEEEHGRQKPGQVCGSCVDFLSRYYELVYTFTSSVFMVCWVFQDGLGREVRYPYPLRRRHCHGLYSHKIAQDGPLILISLRTIFLVTYTGRHPTLSGRPPIDLLYSLSQGKKGKDAKQPTALASAVVAESKPAVNHQSFDGDSLSDARGWQGNSNVQERQGMLVGHHQPPTPKVVVVNGVNTANGVGAAAARGKGRRAGAGRPAVASKTTATKSSRNDAPSAKFSVKGKRDDEQLPEVSSPVRAHENAERKDAQSPEYPSSMRKSPRSKEVWCPGRSIALGLLPTYDACLHSYLYRATETVKSHGATKSI